MSGRSSAFRTSPESLVAKGIRADAPPSVSPLALPLSACGDRGTVLVVATHDDRLSAKISRRVILADGKLREA